MRSLNGKLCRARTLAICLVLAAVPCGGAQNTQQTPRPTPGAQLPLPGGGNEDEPQDPMQRKVLHDAGKKRNEERQQQLKADASRLLALAQELKAEVDKSSKDTLSVDVVKKADEIEKLAKSVKEKMKGTP